MSLISLTLLRRFNGRSLDDGGIFPARIGSFIPLEELCPWLLISEILVLAFSMPQPDPASDYLISVMMALAFMAIAATLPKRPNSFAMQSLLRFFKNNYKIIIQ